MGNTANIAVLLTCHNRKEKTLKSLSYLYNATLPKGYEIDTFLVDDGSTDGTNEAVEKSFPQVNIIQGNGSLFWNKGMRLAWDVASKAKDYDFYLWINDDTLVNKYFLEQLLQSYNELSKENGIEAILTGACRSSFQSNEFSYGGRTETGPVIPNGKLQPCKYINGNVVLISKRIHQNLGNLSADYTHNFGDHDYGLRALQAGFKCYTTKTYVAVCPLNTGVRAWCNPEVPLKKRLKLWNSPMGPNLKEYSRYRKKFWGKKGIIIAAKFYAKAPFQILFPRLFLNSN